VPEETAAAPPAIPLATLLPRVGAAVDRHRRRLAARCGLTATALAVLAALDPDDGPSHRDLAARLGIGPATLTPVLDLLEAGGHVRRERDPADRRIVRVRRTPLGRQRLAAAEPVALPEPAPDHEPVLRAYLLAVLAAVDADDWL
jgi:DNA-binding MarR family transcriptional regulator